jgi:hypothetical protein
MHPEQHPQPNAETTLLAGLLAWEQFFGRRVLSGVELKDLGVSLTPAEGRLYLDHRLEDPWKSTLYQALFESHPELQTYIDRKTATEVVQDGRRLARRDGRSAHAHQFIARITGGGGPSPDFELAALIRRASVSGAGTSWFPTRILGREWRPPRRLTNRSAFSFTSGRVPAWTRLWA